MFHSIRTNLNEAINISVDEYVSAYPNENAKTSIDKVIQAIKRTIDTAIVFSAHKKRRPGIEMPGHPQIAPSKKIVVMVRALAQCRRA